MTIDEFNSFDYDKKCEVISNILKKVNSFFIDFYQCDDEDPKVFNIEKDDDDTWFLEYKYYGKQISETIDDFQIRDDSCLYVKFIGEYEVYEKVYFSKSINISNLISDMK